jgi:hypothetical protein
MKPPLTLEAQLQRVLRIAKFDGTCLVVIAGLGGVLSLAFGDYVGVTVCVLIAIAGRMELVGRRQLVQGDADGMRRLMRCQLIVLNVILIYCLRVILTFDLETSLGTLMQYSQQLNELGLDVGAMVSLIRSELPLVVYTSYGLFALITIFFQGGLWLYYRRRTGVVKQALAERRRPVIPPVTKVSPEDLVT